MLCGPACHLFKLQRLSRQETIATLSVITAPLQGRWVPGAIPDMKTNAREISPRVGMSWRG
jgi:hypothetical protein